MRVTDSYTPILRWRSAERAALKLIDEDVKAALTPLIEVPPDIFVPRSIGRGKGTLRKPRAASIICQDLVSELTKWWGQDRVFLDFSLLYRTPQLAEVSAWELILPLLSEASLEVVPVLTMGHSSPQEWQPKPSILLSSSPAGQSGICLRVKEICLHAPNLKQRIDHLLEEVKLSPEVIDLVVDSECVNDASLGLALICARIPYLKDWRTFTVAGGSFPEDLSQERGFKPGEVAYRRRLEWVRWKEQSSLQNLERVPAFGDYAVQFARYHPPKGNPRPSASVRYTSDEQWLILRGEMIQGHPIGRGQWTGWAQVLCEMEEYLGPAFSAGDAYIYSRSQDSKNPGTSTDWLFASINHHLTLAVRQLSNLSAV